MSSDRQTFALRIGLSAATAVLILAGATLNVSGREGRETLLAAGGGLPALLAGALPRRWQFAVPLGIAALVLTVLAEPLNPLDVAGLLLVGLGGFTGAIAYRGF